jgi:hypothetical protein
MRHLSNEGIILFGLVDMRLDCTIYEGAYFEWGFSVVRDSRILSFMKDGRDDGWQAFLNQKQRRLWEEAWLLLRQEREKRRHVLVDYGFIVFGAAKVYEGFLKSFFYQMGFISRYHFYDEHFRIGKSLNLDLPERLRDGSWVVDDLQRVCGLGTAKQLWEAWKVGRNRVFHYRDGEEGYLTLDQAEELLLVIRAAMQTAAACEVRIKRGE